MCAAVDQSFISSSVRTLGVCRAEGAMTDVIKVLIGAGGGMGRQGGRRGPMGGSKYLIY